MAARLLLPTALPAASALDMSLRTHVPKINEIMRDCDGYQVERMQAALEEIVTLCIENDLAYQKRIHCRECGIHNKNRAKSGVDAVDAQNLALNISREGYKESKLTISMGFEKAESGTAAESAQRDHMRRVYALSEGYLRNVPFQYAEYLPVTNSHLFAALNIVTGVEVRGRHEELSTDGFVNMLKVLNLLGCGLGWNVPLLRRVIKTVANPNFEH